MQGCSKKGNPYTIMESNLSRWYETTTQKKLLEWNIKRRDDLNLAHTESYFDTIPTH